MITARMENKEFSEILEALLEDGLDGMPRVFEMLMNMAMKIERNRALRAEPFAYVEYENRHNVLRSLAAACKHGEK